MLRTILTVSLGVLTAGLAQAQSCIDTGNYPTPGVGGVIDCSGGCTETFYGLGRPEDARPTDPTGDEAASLGLVEPTRRSDFLGSYSVNTGTASPFDPACDGEDGFQTINGTWIFREQTSCDPFDTATNPDGCPVEMATDLTNAQGIRHFWASPLVLADNSVCGFEPPSTLLFCETFIQTASNSTQVGIGHRRPDTARCPTCTLIEFDDCLGTPVGGMTRICCNSDPFDAVDICATLSGGRGVAKYPLTPALEGFGGAVANAPPLLFDGDTTNFGPWGKFEVGTRLVENQRYGVCNVNRTVGCDCKENGASCGDTVDPDGPGPAIAPDPCPTFDINPQLGGVQPDHCDLVDRGWRLNQETLLADGSQNPNECQGFLAVYRGIPRENCLLRTDYITTAGEDGDPGADCSVANFGAHRRPDADCDGVADLPDLCPFYSEADFFSDTNGNGRGDECECGDITGDGLVNIADILAQNSDIFNPTGWGWFVDPNFFYGPSSFRRLFHPLGDATNDPTVDDTPGNPTDLNMNWDTGGDINVADILAVNSAIFGDNQTVCARSPVVGQ